MPTFRFKAVDSANELATGILSAADQQSAAAELGVRGLTPFLIELNGERDRGSTSKKTGQGLRPADVIDFLSRLRMLLRAGLDVDRAMEFLSRSATMTRVRRAADQARKELRSGHSLADALESPKIGMPPFVIAVLRAGEASGQVDKVLELALVYLERRNKLMSELRSALVYPATLVLVAFVTVGIIITVLVPKLRLLFVESGRPLPSAAAFIFDLSDLAMNWGWLLAPITAGVVGLAQAFSRYNGGITLDRLKLSSPLMFGWLRLRVELASLTKQLGILLNSGVLIDDALELSRASTKNRALAQTFVEVRGDLRKGVRLGVAMRKSSVLPDVFVQLVSAGEEASQLPETLLRVSEVYEAEAEASIKRFMTLLGPAITVVLGLVIGFIIYSIMAALMSVNDLALG